VNTILKFKYYGTQFMSRIFRLVIFLLYPYINIKPVTFIKTSLKNNKIKAIVNQCQDRSRSLLTFSGS
jgi:hypothetical protein